jgi:antitoxin (DNA-binding transcriptional repressor) of toxin-antitoxin stability system
MRQVALREFRLHMQKTLNAVEFLGERVTLTRAGTPIATIGPCEGERVPKGKPVGVSKRE